MSIKLLKMSILLSGLSFIVSGCISSTPTHYYVLQPTQSKADKTQMATPKDLLIGIGPVELPKLLNRSHIVTMLENGNVQVAEFHQWGEPLNANVTRVLASNIKALRSSDVIRLYPWGAFGTVDYRVALNFLQFDSTPGRSITVEVDWAIMNEKDHKIMKNGHTLIKQSLEHHSYSHSVEALSKALEQLSQEISGSMDLLSLSLANK